MKIKDWKNGQYSFICLGCNMQHTFNDKWAFDHNFDSPTISPSILVKGTRFDEETDNSVSCLCHSFIKNGKIQYLNDCEHKLAGQTIELPDFKNNKTKLF